MNNTLNVSANTDNSLAQIQVFENTEFGKVRIVRIDDTPYFVGKEVATILNYQNGSRDVRRHVDAEDRQIISLFDGKQNRDAIIINESGLYSLILGSKLPSAKKFKHWVTSEVLPSIRKNGSYTMPSKSKEEIAIMEHTNKIAEANIYTRLAEKYSGNKDYAQILDAYATKALEGKFVLPLPERGEPDYSATEVGEELGVSSKKVGRIANRLGIKVDGEFGRWYVDKSRFSNKEVSTFRYTRKAIDLIKDDLNKEREAADDSYRA